MVCVSMCVCVCVCFPHPPKQQVRCTPKRDNVGTINPLNYHFHTHTLKSCSLHQKAEILNGHILVWEQALAKLYVLYFTGHQK